jgi:hypothetical protein
MLNVNSDVIKLASFSMLTKNMRAYIFSYLEKFKVQKQYIFIFKNYTKVIPDRPNRVGS